MYCYYTTKVCVCQANLTQIFPHFLNKNKAYSTFPNHLQLSWCINRIAYWERICQLTRLASFDDLLDKSHSETDGHDARADDLTRRLRQTAKNEIYPKAAERDRGRTPKRLSGRLRDRSALDFSCRLFAVRACACLGERSEPTCIRQAHVTVPNGHNSG